MKILIVFFSIAFLSTKTQAADTLVTKLINTIYLERVTKDVPYYYLIDSASNPKFNNWDVEELIRSGQLDSISLPVQDFLKNLQKDTSTITWVGYKFLKARIIEKRNWPKYNYSYRVYKYFPYTTPDSILSKLNPEVIPVLVRRNTSKKQQNTALQTATRKYDAKPREEKNCYYFSKPIFSDDKNFVLISLNDADHGCNYVFKRSGNGWIKVLQFKCWVS